MGRIFIWCLACCVAVGLTAEPALANDRDSASGVRGRETHAILGSRDAAAGSAAKPIETTFASRPNDATVQQTNTAASREHHGLTLFQFDSKLGHVAVQPVVGTVKGAQLSISF